MEFDFEPGDRIMYDVELSKSEKLNARLHQMRAQVIGRDPDEPLSEAEILQCIKEIEDECIVCK